jgi:DNA repair protein SbcC/Rad50
MIIKSLYCKNFMKFRELDLRDIPEKGLIGIIGENEAGKSTIGEAISFGLFGECTRGDIRHLDNILFWGEEEGFVQVKVLFGSELFILSRNVSNEGISLRIRNETLGTELDEESIDEFYRERLKLSFKEFRYSSYVAQKELAIIQSQKEDRLDVIDSMLGLNKLNNTEEFLASEIDLSHGKVQKVENILEGLRTSLAAINEELTEKKIILDEISVHEAEKTEIAGSIADSEKGIELLNSFEESYQRHRLLKEQIALLEGNREKQNAKIRAFNTLDSELDKREEQLEQAGKSLKEGEEIKADLDKQLQAHEQKEKLAGACDSLKKDRETKQESLSSLSETLKILAEEGSEIEKQLEEAEAELKAENKALKEIDVLKQELQEHKVRKDRLEKNTAELPESRTKLDHSSRIVTLIENVNEERESLIASCTQDENGIKAELGKVEERFSELNKRLGELNDEDIIDSRKTTLAKRRGKDIFFWVLFSFSAVGLAGWVIATEVMMYLSFGIFPVIVLLITAIVSSVKTNKLQKELNEELLLIQEEKDGIDRECSAHSKSKIALNNQRAEIVRVCGILKGIKLTERSEIEASLAKVGELPEKQFEFSLVRIQDFLQENSVEGPIKAYHAHLKETLQKLEGDLEELKELNQTCSELTNALLKLQIRKESIHSFEKKIDDVRTRLSRKKLEENRFADSREKLEAEIGQLGNEIGEIESQLEGFSLTDATAEEKSEMQSKLRENACHTDDLKESILETKEAISSLNRQKAERKQLLEENDQHKNELDSVKDEFQGLGKQLSDIDFSPEKLNGLREQLKNDNFQMVEILEAIARKTTMLERFQDTESKKKQVIAEIQEGESKEKQLRENMLYFPEVIKLYGQTRDNIIKKIRPQIERYFSTYLPKLTNNRYKKVSLQEDFSIRIFSDEKNGYVPIKNLSGGTEDQVLLMLRLAFSKALFPALREVDGKMGFHQFLFLDEPISSFDQKRQNAFIELLRIMEQVYQQIFVISHIGELENKMDYFIKAEASSNVLEVERL